MVAQLDKEYLVYGPGRATARLVSYALFEGRPLTTRGRWINPLVFGIASGIKRLPQLTRVERPIFIVGVGRSGTTILGLALSLHSEVGFLNEPKALWHSAMPFEDVIGNFAGGRRGKYILDRDDATSDVVRNFHRLYGAYLRITGRTRVVDKYPEAIYRIEFIRRVFPDARFIWISRNGNDVIRSIANWSAAFGRSSGAGTRNWWGKNDRKWLGLVSQVCPRIPELSAVLTEIQALTGDVDRAAVEWSATALFGCTQMARHADCVLPVHYESLTNEPQQTIKMILEFCSLSDDDAIRKYVVAKVRPKGGYGPQDIPVAVRPAFAAAMSQLGYS